MHRKVVLVSFAALALSGCNSEIKNAVTEKLKDPYSVKFENILRQQTRACVRYNAKNSYGAYAGLQTAHLVDIGAPTSGTQWYVESTDDSDCSTYELGRRLEIDQQDKQSENEVLALLKLQKLAPETTKDIDEIAFGDGPCASFIQDLMTSARLAHSSGDEKSKTEWKQEFDSGLIELKKGACPQTESKVAQAARDASAVDAVEAAADAAQAAADAAAAAAAAGE